jgi:hypothetical protein
MVDANDKICAWGNSAPAPTAETMRVGKDPETLDRKVVSKGAAKGETIAEGQ